MTTSRQSRFSAATEAAIAEKQVELASRELELAQRRFEELKAKGVDVDFDSTLKDMLDRDERDSGRELAPLAQAADAILVDSSDRSLDEVVAEMLACVRQREAVA